MRATCSHRAWQSTVRFRADGLQPGDFGRFFSTDQLTGGFHPAGFGFRVTRSAAQACPSLRSCSFSLPARSRVERRQRPLEQPGRYYDNTRLYADPHEERRVAPACPLPPRHRPDEPTGESELSVRLFLPRAGLNSGRLVGRGGRTFLVGGLSSAAGGVHVQLRWFSSGARLQANVVTIQQHLPLDVTFA